jgi:hypothetical protein
MAGRTGEATEGEELPGPSGSAGSDSKTRWQAKAAGYTDGDFILHLIQRPFGIGRILIRLELVTHALNSDSFCGSMLIQ